MTCLEPAPTDTVDHPHPECVRCHRRKPHKGRGLCSPCYQSVMVYRRHELAKYPTVPRPPSTRPRRIVECARCGTEQRHWARGLCQRCYNHLAKHGGREEYPTSSMSMDVDEVVVQRTVDWLIAYAAHTPAERPGFRPRRPATTRGERIEVLRRTRHDVPKWVAVEALGISGRKATEYLAPEGS